VLKIEGFTTPEREVSKGVKRQMVGAEKQRGMMEKEGQKERKSVGKGNESRFPGRVKSTVRKKKGGGGRGQRQTGWGGEGDRDNKRKVGKGRVKVAKEGENWQMGKKGS